VVALPDPEVVLDDEGVLELQADRISPPTMTAPMRRTPFTCAYFPSDRLPRTLPLRLLRLRRRSGL
jgi:hypothetical protein